MLVTPDALLPVLDAYVPAAARTLEELRADGYCVTLTKKDPFSPEHHAAVVEALLRYSLLSHSIELRCYNFMPYSCAFRIDRDGGAAMGSYTNVFKWLSQSVLGNARKVAHVQYFVTRTLPNSRLAMDSASDDSSGDDDDHGDDDEN